MTISALLFGVFTFVFSALLLVLSFRNIICSYKELFCAYQKEFISLKELSSVQARRIDLLEALIAQHGFDPNGKRKPRPLEQTQ